MLGQNSKVSPSHKNKERRPCKDMSGNVCVFFFGGGGGGVHWKPW